MNGHTILGDIVVPQPPATPSNVPAMAAMATVLGLGAMGTYLLTRDVPQPPPVVAPVEQEPPSFEDESLSIGLGHIDDYRLPEPVE